MGIIFHLYMSGLLCYITEAFLRLNEGCGNMTG